MSKTKSDYNTKLAGEKLFERMASLFRGVKPSSDGVTVSEAEFSEHSMAVAENFVAKFGNNIPTAIFLAEKEKKQYRKFAAEALKQAHKALLAKCTVLAPSEKDGKPIEAVFKNNPRFTVIAHNYHEELEATVGYMLDMLGRAPDSEILEESQKKARNNGRQKLMAEFDSGKYAQGETIHGGNEFSEGTAYASAMLWDIDGIMKGILKLSARCAAASDRDQVMDAGEMYAVLTGDLPFPKSGKEYNIGLSPDIADLLIKGRLYHRIGEAFKTKVDELTALMEEGDSAQNAEAMKVFQSGVLQDSLARTEQMKEAAARKKAAAPVPVETPTVAAVVASTDELAALKTRLQSEWDAENAKGDKANRKAINNIARQAAVFHPEHTARYEQHNGGLLSDAEFRQIELSLGVQVLTDQIPTTEEVAK